MNIRSANFKDMFCIYIPVVILTFIRNLSLSIVKFSLRREIELNNECGVFSTNQHEILRSLQSIRHLLETDPINIPENSSIVS